MTLLERLDKLEKQLEKVRGCSPLTHGWQTQKYAKASRKWDYLAERKRKLIDLIEEGEQNKLSSSRRQEGDKNTNKSIYLQ